MGISSFFRGGNSRQKPENSRSHSRAPNSDLEDDDYDKQWVSSIIPFFSMSSRYVALVSPSQRSLQGPSASYNPGAALRMHCRFSPLTRVVRENTPTWLYARLAIDDALPASHQTLEGGCPVRTMHRGLVDDVFVAPPMVHLTLSGHATNLYGWSVPRRQGRRLQPPRGDVRVLGRGSDGGNASDTSTSIYTYNRMVFGLFLLVDRLPESGGARHRVNRRTLDLRHRLQRRRPLPRSALSDASRS